MNVYTIQIAELLQVDSKTAYKVQYEMECGGLDFSECTEQEFRYAAREAYLLVNCEYA